MGGRAVSGNRGRGLDGREGRGAGDRGQAAVRRDQPCGSRWTLLPPVPSLMVFLLLLLVSI